MCSVCLLVCLLVCLVNRCWIVVFSMCVCFLWVGSWSEWVSRTRTRTNPNPNELWRELESGGGSVTGTTQRMTQQRTANNLDDSRGRHSRGLFSRVLVYEKCYLQHCVGGEVRVEKILSLGGAWTHFIIELCTLFRSKNCPKGFFSRCEACESWRMLGMP